LSASALFHHSAAEASGKASGTPRTGFDMRLLQLNVFQLAADWSVWAAGIIGLSVFVQVHRWSPRFLPTLDQGLAWLRRPARSEPARAEVVHTVVEPIELDDEWQRADWQSDDWQHEDHLREDHLLRDRLHEDWLQAEWERQFHEAQLNGLDRAEAARERAERLIDAAEYMLDRTFEECAAVLQSAEAIERLHRILDVSAEPTAERPARDTDNTKPASVAA
jgi:hypothetical protein